jgi:hypothetical protein
MGMLAHQAACGEKPVEADQRIIGMYVHQHWPYKHPYAARTWTVQDWRGYASGLKQIGFNTILIWPVVETMPDPPTPSDRASLVKLGKVIDMLHNELQMRVYITLCPNIIARDAEASKATFEKRHYYYCEDLVNPGDAAAVERLIQRREKLLKYLAKADGFTIIDSDPGGYPNASIAQFVHLLAAHRKMFDRLRPGIELIYWVHAGWRGWGRLYETGKLVFGTPDEYIETMTRLKEANLEPWGLANGLNFAQQLGLANRVISFNYGRIEGEPSFPLTNFTGQNAYDGAKADAPRGVMGNAQTHCVQLPNTFAFARGAQGLPLTEADYMQFAEDLIPGQGTEILAAWRTLPGTDAAAMRALADRLEVLPDEKIAPGRLKGLLFNNPRRFLTDLVKMLRYRAALEDFVAASEKGEGVKVTLRKFIAASETWQSTHGYKNNWHDPRMHAALRKIKHPAIDAVFEISYEVRSAPPAGQSYFEAIRQNFATIETLTPRFLQAMKAALKDMPGR